MLKLKDTYDAILFDVGNTLLIRDPPGYEILAERCREIGLPIGQAAARRAWKQSELWMGEQLLREMNNPLNPPLLRGSGAPRMADDELFQHLDFIALQAAFNDKMEDEIRHLVTCLQEIPPRRQVWVLADGVHETLTGLKQVEFKLGIASNFDETLPDLCDEFDLTPYFDTIVASSLVGVEKPDPEILRITCRQLGVSPSASFYVGDHPFDVLCAKEAGMSVAWLCEPSDTLPERIPHQPDYRIQSIVELLEAV